VRSSPLQANRIEAALPVPIEKATQTGRIEEVTVMPPALAGTLADKWGKPGLCRTLLAFSGAAKTQ